MAKVQRRPVCVQPVCVLACTGERTGRRGESRKRAVVAVQVAAFSVVVVGFTALTLDVGIMYNAKADLQRTADAAALAAASQLADYSMREGDDPGATPTERAQRHATDAAIQYVQGNPILRQTVNIDENTDITFGRASFNPSTQKYDFTPDTELPDAIRIRVRKTADSVNNSLSLYFAPVFGIGDAELSAEATAIMVPRDIAIVADLSGSHTDDSELRHYQLTEINLFDVWDALPIPKGNNGVGNGIDPPPPGDPNHPNDPPGTGPGHPGNQGGNPDPGADPQGGQVGPTWGWMYYWGNTIDEHYEPEDDPGLMHFPRYQRWNNADLATWYETVGYSHDEVQALLDDDYDGSRDSQGQYGWTNRVAVALGLARWDSGIAGGLWESIPPGRRNDGNGNPWVGTGELTWLVDYPFDSGSWSDYTYNYVRRTSTNMYQANHHFRYRFGLKTFANYLLERKPRHDQTPELADVPTQPMQAVKEAVNFMVDFIDDLDTDDQLSLEIYGTWGRHEVDLTHNHQEIAERLNEMQAAHYDSWTNIGGGVERAIEELASPRARSLSRKMIILLTDGNANTNAEGQWDPSGARVYALAEAQTAASLGTNIFAVSVGASADQSLMEEIAAIGGGEHFHAEGSIEEYSAQLMEIFQRLGSTRPVELIQ